MVESIDNYNACILGKFPCLVEKDKKLYNKNGEEAFESKLNAKEAVTKDMMVALLLHGADSFGMEVLKVLWLNICQWEQTSTPNLYRKQLTY